MMIDTMAVFSVLTTPDRVRQTDGETVCDSIQRHA